MTNWSPGNEAPWEQNPWDGGAPAVSPPRARQPFTPPADTEPDGFSVDGDLDALQEMFNADKAAFKHAASHSGDMDYPDHAGAPSQHSDGYDNGHTPDFEEPFEEAFEDRNQFDSPIGAPSTTTASSSPRRAGNSKRPLAIAAALAGVLAIGGGAALTLGGEDDPAPKTATAAAPKPSGKPLTRTVPAGWASRAVWSLPANIQSNVAVNGNTIAYLSPTGSLVIQDQAGKLLGSSAPTGLPTTANVGVTTIGADPVVVATDGKKTLVWSIKGLDSTASAKQLNPNGGIVSWSGGALMVSKGNQAWLPGPDLKLAPVKVPAGHTPLGASPDGSVITAKPSGPWQIVNPKGAASTVTPKKPNGLVGQMNPAWAANNVLVAWGATNDTNKRVVAFFDAKTGAIKAQGTLPTATVNLGLNLSVNNAGTRASAGPLLANLETGATTVPVGWQTVSVDALNLYGQTDGERRVWTGKGDVNSLEDTVAVPWGSTANGNAVLVDVAASGQQALASVPQG